MIPCASKTVRHKTQSFSLAVLMEDVDSVVGNDLGIFQD
jgi:hypothetical protein